MNETIRQAAKTSGVYLWQIADELGVTDGTLSRKLRHELPKSEAEKILEFIAEHTNKEG
jgi:hypothetical protein